mmetsp:Transcript_26191/g.53653  ORF Transcript_26191/g.53653 Transcript_26191/m.53653 type:complete len:112 (-) Transcript_26191:254-589(-)|eukprot:CAMPEP_0183298644 /NCGR_PEP_ID=MMETSP0160_2-20130417/5599_1 /TAXON_ID=2839 ORGANISM="Odontella Sinensis, Strain Grunow 1884" /NCGR_SAMPLE_ID=MMETSP0160_2 /ASSEMBLY_ACC=CAM_ASM_000250 /LENGTH=111 /DNA_ID=CAMNT_0025460733 /DNA_START=87 /DNA_END=422 /DNA_ORIENTATION=-
MIARNSIILLIVGVVCALLPQSCEAFVVKPHAGVKAPVSTTAVYLGNFGKKKEPEEDLSYIESRDMTRAEMEAVNKKNEDIMNMELGAMTAFSLILSLPILYLCWVAFFSD